MNPYSPPTEEIVKAELADRPRRNPWLLETLWTIVCLVVVATLLLTAAAAWYSILGGT